MPRFKKLAGINGKALKPLVSAPKPRQCGFSPLPLQNSWGISLILLMFLLGACNVQRKPDAPTPIPTTLAVAAKPTNTTVPLNTPTVTPSLSPASATPRPSNTSVAVTSTPVIIAPPVNTLVPTAIPSPTPLTTNAQVIEGGDGLRLRAAPSTSGAILTRLDELTPLIVLGRTADNVWYSVRTTSGQSGWVMAQYVEMRVDASTIPQIDSAANPLPTAQTAFASGGADGMVVGEGQGVRLRALPSTNGTIVDYLTEQTQLDIIGRTADNTWLQVVTPTQKIGWVWAAYVQHSLDLATVSIPEEASVPTPAAYQPPNVSAAAGNISGISSNAAQIFLRGQSLGNYPNTFSKVGDSITETAQFMYQFGFGNYDLGEHAYLREVINYFISQNVVDGNTNSFNHISFASKSGWISADVLNPASNKTTLCQPNEMPLVCEYRIVKPSVSLIMVGTNDIINGNAYLLQQNLDRIVQISIDMGVIPVLSTIPLRVGHDALVAQFNQIITSTARRFDVPLWDFYTGMSQLPNMGLDPDGLHPSFVGDNYHNYVPSVTFTAENLQKGYPFRNLTGLQVLDALWRQVIAPNLQYAGAVVGTNTDGLSNSAAANPPPAASNGSCPGAPAPRLSIGTQGRVTPGEPNNVRAEPNPASAKIGQIPGGEAFMVLAGPVCSDSTNYWKVNYNGLEGWTGEGKNGVYWVEPVG